MVILKVINCLNYNKLNRCNNYCCNRVTAGLFNQSLILESVVTNSSSIIVGSSLAPCIRLEWMVWRRQTYYLSAATIFTVVLYFCVKKYERTLRVKSNNELHLGRLQPRLQILN